MKGRLFFSVFGLALSLASNLSQSGPMDPDCTAGKAVKSAAMKATVGVGGRCSAAEAVTDTAKDAVGLEDKGPLEKRRDDDGPAKKAADKAAKKIVE